MAAWRAPQTLLVGRVFRTPPLPFCGLSSVAPPVLTITLLATRELPFLAFPQLRQGLEWLGRPLGQGSPSVRQAPWPGREGLRFLWAQVLFLLSRVPVISGARIGCGQGVGVPGSAYSAWRGS